MAISGQLILLLILMVVIFRIDGARAFKLTLGVVIVARILSPVRVLIVVSHIIALLLVLLWGTSGGLLV